MTLTITVAAPWGIWQCSDHRLTPSPSERDASLKQLLVVCPDSTALVTYAGVGRFGDVDVSEWLRTRLRGYDRPLNDTLALILAASNERLARPALLQQPRPVHHLFTVSAFRNGKPWVYTISNFVVGSDLYAAPVLPQFRFGEVELGDSGGHGVTGAREAVSQEDYEVLDRISQRPPARPEDYQHRLAAINRRAARHPSIGCLISPSCVTSFLPPAGTGVRPIFHGPDGKADARLSVLPTLVRGIDMTPVMLRSRDVVLALQRGEHAEADRLQSQLDEETKAAVQPEDLYRRFR